MPGLAAQRCAMWTPLASALGRVTAEPVRPRRPSPWFACAATDGLAVCSSDVDGEPPHMLPAGYVDVVGTGRPLPARYDAVLPSDEIVWRGEHVLLDGPVVPGRNVRQVGEDIPGDAALLPAGHRLRPVDLGACASTGHTAVRVTRRPRIAIVPTGDEQRPLGASLLRGEVTESNSVMIAARVTELGADVSVAAAQPDDPEVLAVRLRRACRSADLVVVIAGSGAGRDDHTAAAVTSCGAVVVHGVGLRPGYSTLLGVLGPVGDEGVTPVLGLPGDTVAAAVAFEVFGTPMLASLEGTVPVPAHREPAVLESAIRSRRGFEEWVRVALVPRDDELPVARPRGQGAGMLSSVVGADGLIGVAPSLAGLEAGEVVTVHLLPGCAPRGAAVTTI